jgi:biotin transporter BioY
MYETKSQPLAPMSVFRKRIRKSMLTGLLILLVCLLLGILGYHYTAGIPWLDALHNASMILSGMGPVVEIRTVSGKWFSSFYALFSGVIFITNIGITLAPAIHRFLHRMHVPVEKEKD